MKRESEVDVVKEAQNDILDAVVQACFDVVLFNKQLPEGWALKEYLQVIQEQGERVRALFGYDEPKLHLIHPNMVEQLVKDARESRDKPKTESKDITGAKSN